MSVGNWMLSVLRERLAGLEGRGDTARRLDVAAVREEEDPRSGLRVGLLLIGCELLAVDGRRNLAVRPIDLGKHVVDDQSDQVAVRVEPLVDAPLLVPSDMDRVPAE